MWVLALWRTHRSCPHFKVWCVLDGVRLVYPVWQNLTVYVGGYLLTGGQRVPIVI